jgi:DNA-binding CsgD family transcriptional regulator
MSVSAANTREGLLALSPREGEVLAIASLGLTNKEVASRLNVSVHAVKFHLAGIYRKLGVNNRTEATVVYLRAADAAAQERLELAG